MYELVENVETQYKFLTSALAVSKTKCMVDNKWLNITDTIDVLGAGPKPDVEKMKSPGKKNVAEL